MNVDNHDLSLIIEAVIKDRGIARSYGIIAAVAGGIFLITDLALLISGTARVQALTIYVIRSFWFLFLLIAFALYYKWKNLEDPYQSPFVRALVERSEEIVWIYEMRARSIFGNFSSIRIHLEGDHMFQLSLGHGRVDGALGLLAEISPEAMVGFSRENSEKYYRLIKDRQKEQDHSDLNRKKS